MLIDLKKLPIKRLNLAILLTSWSLAFFWIVSIPNKNVDAQILTYKILSQVKIWIERYQKKYNFLPQSINEVRAFARSNGYKFSVYDALLQRLEYIPLDQENYIVRSFGFDGIENNILRKDDWIISTINKSLNYVAFKKHAVSIFTPFMLLQGVLAPNGLVVARSFYNPISFQKILVVQSLRDPNHIMVANHSNIQEFVFLGDLSHKIIYTAAATHRYDAGLYVWDLLSNEREKLFSQENVSQHPEEHFIILQQSPFMVAIVPKERDSLSLLEVAKKEYLYTVSLSSTKINLIRYYRTDDLPIEELLAIPFLDCSKGTLTQIQWCNLKIEGELNDIVNSWQNFVAQSAKTPIFPYGLWILIHIYNDGIAYLNENHNRINEIDIFRSYAIELLEVLMESSATSAWLKASGWYAFEAFREQKTLPYQVSKLYVK